MCVGPECQTCAMCAGQAALRGLQNELQAATCLASGRGCNHANVPFSALHQLCTCASTLCRASRTRRFVCGWDRRHDAAAEWFRLLVALSTSYPAQYKSFQKRNATQGEVQGYSILCCCTSCTSASDCSHCGHKQRAAPQFPEQPSSCLSLAR